MTKRRFNMEALRARMIAQSPREVKVFLDGARAMLELTAPDLLPLFDDSRHDSERIWQSRTENTKNVQSLAIFWSKLTPRERQILGWYFHIGTTLGVARRLQCDPDTVKKALRRVVKKSGIEGATPRVLLATLGKMGVTPHSSGEPVDGWSPARYS